MHAEVRALSHKGARVLLYPQAETMTAHERFEEKYEVEPNTGCWLWTAGLYPEGYGSFKVGGTKKTAHRVSYELHKGDIPDGLFVLHMCDVRSCVNPAHLYAGSHQQNMADRNARGRQARGENNGRAKLTRDEVLAIYKETHSPNSRPVREISEEYGVSGKNIRFIKAGESWAHVTASEGSLN